MTKVLLALFLMSGIAHAETRWALVIGNNVGAAGEAHLRWAEQDARKVLEVLRDLGDVPAENAVASFGDDADAVRHALLALNERIRQGRPEDATLFVYYSGHADAEALHLGDTRLPVSELESFVRGSAAGMRVLIVDACRSGALTRVKGGVIGAPVPIALHAEASPDGLAFLTASARDEDAQESDEVRGSFFTHYLVSGLRGAADADGDGAVDLAEVYRYAYDHTLRASSTSDLGLQHPTFRHELKGRSDFVLTRVHTAQAFIDLPAGTWLVMRAGGMVLAEVHALDRRRRVAVRPEPLVVRGRTKHALLEGRVTPRAGEVVDVGKVALTKSTFARLVRKGGGPVAAHAIEGGYRLASPLETLGDPSHGVWLGFTQDRRDLSLGARLGLAFGGYTSYGTGNDAVAATPLVVSSRVLELAVGLGHTFDLDALGLELAVDLGLAWLHQGSDSYGRGVARDSLAGRVGGRLGAIVDLSVRHYLRADASALVWVFERDGAGVDDAARLTPVVGWRLELGLGVRF